MNSEDRFVTLWRSVIAYPLAMTAGAMAFFPFLEFGRWQPMFPGKGFVSNASAFIQLEAGAVMMGIFVFSVPVLPFYACGMLIANKFRIRHWLYFSSLGTMVSTGIVMAIYLSGLHSGIDRTPYPLLIRVVMPIGAVGGFVCWAFLRFAWRLRRSPDS